MTGRPAAARAGEPRGTLGRGTDIAAPLAVEKAANEFAAPVARLWRELAATAGRALTPRPLDAVLRDALSAIGRLLSVDGVAILLANEAGDELMARAAIGLGEELSVGLGIHAGGGLAGKVLRTRRPLVVGVPVMKPVLRNSGLRPVAAVPILSGGHRHAGRRCDRVVAAIAVERADDVALMAAAIDPRPARPPGT